MTIKTAVPRCRQAMMASCVETLSASATARQRVNLRGNSFSSGINSAPSASPQTTEGLGRKLCFSFSGAGWLTPFHIGVTRCLVEKGIINNHTKVAGASGGALIAAATACGIPADRQMDTYKKMASILRKQGGFIGKIRRVLHDSLDDSLPENAHVICNDRLTIAVLQIWPRFQLQPELVTYFSSREDLINALLTSAHVPLYLESRAPWTVFRDGLYVDGGLIDMIPPIQGAIKVCVFPGSFLFRSDVHISPALLPKFPYSIYQMLAWALIAPEDDAADRLVDLGHEAALRWLEKGIDAPPSG